MDGVSLQEFFSDLPDPRIDRHKRHRLSDVLFIAVCAVVCGAKSFVDMEDFGDAKYEWLEERLGLDNGIPSHDTFRRVFSLIDPSAFGECLINWTSSLAQAYTGGVIALDGKTVRRSFDTSSGVSAIHVLNAWSSANGLCIGQMKVDDKSNEITAMPKLLALLDLKGAVVTADALNCQKEIAGQVIRQGGDWCLALKGNHRSLYEEAKQFCEYGVSNGFEVPVATHKEEDYSHGRCELREAWLLSVGDLGWLEGTGEWPGLKSIVWVRNTRRQKEQQSVESRCYVTSLVNAAQAARSIRGHWEVENCLHWVMDVDFGEDDCRARAGHAAENFALLRKIVLNLIKKESTKNVSIRRKIHRAGWDNGFLERILAGV